MARAAGPPNHPPFPPRYSRLGRTRSFLTLGGGGSKTAGNSPCHATNCVDSLCSHPKYRPTAVGGRVCSSPPPSASLSAGPSSLNSAT
eukprot:2277357-Pyramimonas_sp.AAC.1